MLNLFTRLEFVLQAFRILFLPQDWLETVYGISGVKNVCGMELRYEKFTKVANDISKNLTATVKKEKMQYIHWQTAVPMSTRQLHRWLRL